MITYNMCTICVYIHMYIYITYNYYNMYICVYIYIYSMYYNILLHIYIYIYEYLCTAGSPAP